jgi:hypothetical protein
MRGNGREEKDEREKEPIPGALKFHEDLFL